MLASRRHNLSSRILVTVLLVVGLFAISRGQSSEPQKLKPVPNRLLKQDGDVSPYETWLEEDVRWIISDQERAAFKQIKNDQEREYFIESFWQRRDPTPDTNQNEYKEEHYHRIAYANEQFGAAGVPGWKTDRGRMYIMFGPPDRVETYPSGRPKDQTPNEAAEDVVKESFPSVQRQTRNGTEDAATLPLAVWRYRYIDGIGQDVVFEFVNACRCGDYRMTMTPSPEKNACVFLPQKGPEEPLQWLSLFKCDGRVTRREEPRQMPSGLAASPLIRFKDLEEVVNSYMILNPLPIGIRVDFAKATDITSLVPITVAIRNRDIRFVEKSGTRHATLNIFGRLLTLTGRVAETFEDSVEVDSVLDSKSNSVDDKTTLVETLPLRNANYRLQIAVKDVNADRKAVWLGVIQIGEHERARVSASSLVLAARIDPVAQDVDAPGFFRLGSSSIRPYVAAKQDEAPRVPRDAKLGAWMQVYGLAMDHKTHKPSATFEYTVFNHATNAFVFRDYGSTDPQQNLGSQLTLKETLPIANLKPDTYRLEVRVKDRISGETTERSATFAVD